MKTNRIRIDRLQIRIDRLQKLIKILDKVHRKNYICGQARKIKNGRIMSCAGTIGIDNGITPELFTVYIPNKGEKRVIIQSKKHKYYPEIQALSQAYGLSIDDVEEIFFFSTTPKKAIKKIKKLLKNDFLKKEQK